MVTGGGGTGNNDDSQYTPLSIKSQIKSNKFTTHPHTVCNNPQPIHAAVQTNLTNDTFQDQTRLSTHEPPGMALGILTLVVSSSWQYDSPLPRRDPTHIARRRSRDSREHRPHRCIKPGWVVVVLPPPPPAPIAAPPPPPPPPPVVTTTVVACWEWGQRLSVRTVALDATRLATLTLSPPDRALAGNNNNPTGRRRRHRDELCIPLGRWCGDDLAQVKLRLLFFFSCCCCFLLLLQLQLFNPFVIINFNFTVVLDPLDHFHHLEFEHMLLSV